LVSLNLCLHSLLFGVYLVGRHKAWMWFILKQLIAFVLRDFNVILETNVDLIQFHRRWVLIHLLRRTKLQIRDGGCVLNCSVRMIWSLVFTKWKGMTSCLRSVPNCEDLAVFHSLFSGGYGISEVKLVTRVLLGRLINHDGGRCSRLIINIYVEWFAWNADFFISFSCSCVTTTPLVLESTLGKFFWEQC